MTGNVDGDFGGMLAGFLEGSVGGNFCSGAVIAGGMTGDVDGDFCGAVHGTMNGNIGGDIRDGAIIGTFIGTLDGEDQRK